jgi:hypothetical protein
MFVQDLIALMISVFEPPIILKVAKLLQKTIYRLK